MYSGMAIKTISTRVCYVNNWMRVREDKISRDGKPGIYGVVEKADSVIIAAIEADRIHLVEQYRYPVGDRYWEMPQGIYAGSRGDPVEDARAELLEETGLEAETLTEIGQAFQAYGYSNQLVRFFFASKLRKGEQRPEPEEADLISRSFAIAEFREMVVSGKIRDGMTLACLALLDAKSII